jgi:hypothetical protein
MTSPVPSCARASPTSDGGKSGPTPLGAARLSVFDQAMTQIECGEIDARIVFELS